MLSLFCRYFTDMAVMAWDLADALQPVARIPGRHVDVGIGRPVYTTVHCRRPSVSRRRGTNMEQFSSRSDVIKFPSKPNLNPTYSWRRFRSFYIV